MAIHIKVYVYTDQSKEKVIINNNSSYDIHLREPAKEGMANRRLLEILKGTIRPKPKGVRIVNGHTSPSKIIEVKY